MFCLGIETSCDETSVAVYGDGRLVAERTHTQIPVHSVFGGVVPELASREHLRNLDTLTHDLLVEASCSLADISHIAVTRGPGLLGALLIGISYAKSLSLSLEVPILGINHLHAHLLACEFTGKIVFPALGVLVSGGHTHIYYMLAPDDFVVVGRTLDDAAGEAFDKIAKLMNLPYPGGKYIDVLGQHGTPDKRLFTKPYLQNDNCDFSFSGLKTAVWNHVQNKAVPVLDYTTFRLDTISSEVKDLCASINYTIVATLLEKTGRALALHPDVKTVCVAGGVAANSLIRGEFANFAHRNGLKFLVPDQKYCGDNAAMIALAGVKLAARGYSSSMDFEAIPRGKHVPNDYIINPFYKE